jgi:hypothetical protein
MGLTFLNPAFLLGALAAAAPVIIHLINRRRALVHRFPAVRFLLLADKRTARKFRLYQWLLLALRVLGILLLALVLARPRLTGEDVHAAAAFPPQATVIMLDNSLSMQYRDGQETRLQRAKALATPFLQELRPQDSAAVLPLLPNSTASPTSAFLTHDAATLHEQLLAMQPSHATIALTNAFQQAFTLLQDAPVTRRRIVLLSDFTVHGWEDFHLSRFSVVPEHIELVFIRLGTGQRDANVLVEEVRITEKPFIEHVPLDVTVAVRNRSTTPLRNLRIDLFLGQTKVGEQLIDLRADEQAMVPFRMIAPPAGLHWGEVRLEADHFPEDDRLYFALQTVSPVHVLVVDGDPGTSLFDSEIFYVLNALQPAGTLARALFHPKPVPWEGLDQERLHDYQVIIFCNVETVTSPFQQRLQQFVREGGGLLFFLGNRVNAQRYNALFYRSETLILPVPLGMPVQPEQPATIHTIDTTHEALTIFSAADPLLQRARLYRYFTTEGHPDAVGVTTLLTLQDGQPLLVEKGLGRGKVMLFTSTADRDWTDFPTRTAYVPLLHGLLGHLAHLASASQRPTVFMPTPAMVSGRAEDVGAAVTLWTPDGQERVSRYGADQTHSVAHFTDYTVAGIYRLLAPSGSNLLAVNATRAESHFEKLQLADLQTKFSPLPLVFEQEETLGQANSNHRRPFQELSALVMIALIGVLVSENICANRL